MTREERLIAYVDGELDAQDRAAFEAELAADPVLAEQVARHRRLAARIAAAYAPVLEEPAPPGLVAVASAANDRTGGGRALRRSAVMAACLLAGVVAGRVLWPEQGPLTLRGSELVARGGLAKALTTQLASERGPVNVGLTFVDRQGHYCRTFASSGDRLAGLACRRDSGWVAQVTATWTPPPTPDYRTAASAAPPAVLAAVDAMIAGPALDGPAERAARDAGWKPRPYPPGR